MRKMTLKLDRDELTTLTQIIKAEHEAIEHVIGNWPTNLLKSILRDVLVTAFLKKLILPKTKYTVTLKEYEAECLSVAVMNYEIKTSNPYTIALIQKVKSTPVI